MFAKLYNKIEQFGFSKTTGLLFVALGLGTICFTIFMQFVLKVQPCLLCYIQRVPYLIAGIIGLFIYRPIISFKTKQMLTYICLSLFTINIGVGFYNIGIEHKWWEASKACRGNMGALSFEDMQNAFNPSLIKLADCSVIQWSLFGQNIFTLALINTIASSFLCILLAVILKNKLLAK